ncbi:MAG: hypothetical protein SO015_06165 [Wujia sp.]|nr:hypothetical protein [Wujia sp.]MDY3727725.1 hypothetical protein [Wujia sp.]
MRKRMLGIGILLVLALTAGCAENPEKYETEGNVVTDYQESDTHVTGKIGDWITIDADIQSRPVETSYEVIHYETDDENKRELYKKVFFSEAEVEKLIDWDFGQTREDGTCLINEGIEYDDGDVQYDWNGLPYTNREIIWKPTNEVNYDENSYRNLIRLNALLENCIKEENSELGWILTPETLQVKNVIELAGYTKEEAIQDARELLNQLQINACENPVVIYAIRREDWEKEYENGLEMYGDDPRAETSEVSENDEFYYMIWLDQLNEIPVVTGNRSSTAQNTKGIREYPEEGVYNTIFANKDGILYFSRSTAMYKETGREEKQDIISLQDAIARLDEHYSDVLMQTEHTLYRVNFCYVPDKVGEEEKLVQLSDGNEYGYTVYDLDMIPAWSLEVEYMGSVNNPDDIWHEMIYVNAQTGEFIQ